MIFSDRPSGGGPTRHYAIAGNYQQFRNWLRETGRPASEVVFLWHPDALRGMRGGVLHRIGTWYQDNRECNYALLDFAKIVGLEVVDG